MPYVPDLVIVDSYVHLGGHPGLGWHLWDVLERKVPIIGVAKTHFHLAPAEEVLRGSSKHPLYVSAAGLDVKVAAACVLGMHGENRIPTMLKLVDAHSRE